MNGTSETQMSRETYLSGMVGGSVTENVGAIAAMILAILGLAGILATLLAAIATIIIGAVMLMDGVAVSAAARRLHSHATGVTAGFFGGLAGIILGILALFKTIPDPLLSVAVLVFGAAMLLGGGVVSRLNWMLQLRNSVPQEAAGPVFTAGSGSLFVGLGTLVLGILAVIGIVPLTLVLVGLLTLGAGALFSGSAATADTV